MKIFVKPGSSFKSKNLTLKEKWKIALRDPIYLIVWAISIMFYVYLIITLS